MRQVEKGIAVMQDIAYYVNEVKRDRESLETISMIEQSIEDLSMVSWVNNSLRPETVARGANPSLRTFANIDWNRLLSKLLFIANVNIKFLEDSF